MKCARDVCIRTCKINVASFNISLLGGCIRSQLQKKKGCACSPWRKSTAPPPLLRRRSSCSLTLRYFVLLLKSWLKLFLMKGRMLLVHFVQGYHCSYSLIPIIQKFLLWWFTHSCLSYACHGDGWNCWHDTGKLGGLVGKDFLCVRLWFLAVFFFFTFPIN